MLPAMSATRRPVAVVVGATSKWQADGRNTKLAHGKTLDDSDLPAEVQQAEEPALSATLSLPDEGLDLDERKLIVEQALILLEQNYVHLPLTPDFDMGGVHVNSTIPSHAAYLVAIGGVVHGIGVAKMRDIWWRAATR